jgi:2',3'-cyclic-nucleotide 2'-phosphodiesterase/3'-nucleotidase
MSSASVTNDLRASTSPEGNVNAIHGQPQPVSGPDPKYAIPLRLIATSDLHACLMPFDYFANRPVAGRSLTDLAHRIALARAEVPNNLLFDNGDFLQGNPLADYVASSLRRRRAHPVITAFNTLCYDAVTLGNHEFNYGIGFLSTALSHAKFPVVSANIAARLGKSPLRDKTFVPPFAILRRRLTDTAGRAHTVRIGVIGFAPPQIEVWDRDHLDGRIRVRDIVEAARAWLPRIRARGADVIVALAHSGIGPVVPEDGMENAATALAALEEIDAVIAGHCHLAFPGPEVPASPAVDPVQGRLAGKPAVMPGHSGSHLGIIDLTLSPGPQGRRRWVVTTGTARLCSRVAPQRPPAAALRRAIGVDHRAALVWSQRVLGETQTALHTHFATTVPSAAIELIAAAKAGHSRHALAGTRWADLPLLASAAPFRSGGRGGPENFTDIPPGLLRMRNLSDLYIFPNTLVALAIDGAGVCDWLEQSAAIFNQIAPGATDAPLHDQQVPSFTFDTIPGLTYAIDLSQPARFNVDGQLVNPDARRIVGLCLDGKPLEPDQHVILVTNNHRASRAIATASRHQPEIVLANGTRTQDVLAAHVRGQGTVGAPAAWNWHFLPMPGTTVRIAAGPGSEAHLHDLSPYRPQALGPAMDGFLHYRLHL